MPPDRLRDMLRNQPFQPFRLYTPGGMHYDVAGPDWLLVMEGISVLGIPVRSGDGERVIMFANTHITHAEPLINGAPLA